MSDPVLDPVHAIPAAVQLRRSRFRWRLVAFVALVIAILAGSARFATEFGVGANPASIARISVSGLMMADPQRLKVLETLAEDDTVKAVIVAIDSPGGTSSSGEELYEALGKLRAKKPVVAVVSSLGASAAYMTAIATDRIFVRRLSLVGSIGVYFQTTNAGKLLDTIGVDFDKVQSGPLKGEPDIDEPMGDDVRASLQSIVDDSYAWFVDVVAERRSMDRSAVLALADGRILTGNQAITSGLVDAVGGEAEAIAWLETDKSIAADLPVLTWYPVEQPGWAGIGKWLGGQMRSAIGLPPEGPVLLDGLVSLWQVAP